MEKQKSTNILVILCVILPIVSFIVAFTIGYFVGDSTAIARVNSKISDDASHAYSSAKGSTSSSSVSMYKLGQTGTIGNWKITVKNVQTATDIKSDSNISDDNKTTDQLFVIIDVQMENISSGPLSYSTDDFQLGTLKTKGSFSMDMDAAQVLNDNKTNWENNSSFFEVYNNINPNVPKDTYLVFEVPKNSDLSNLALATYGGASTGSTAGFYLQ